MSRNYAKQSILALKLLGKISSFAKEVAGRTDLEVDTSQIEQAIAIAYIPLPILISNSDLQIYKFAG